MATLSWQGVFPALTTPFTADDQLDLPIFVTNLHAQLAAGVSGVIVGGSLGEASTLTDNERDTLLREALDHVVGAVPVVLGIAEGATAAAIRQAERAAALGVAGLMLLPPMRYKADPRETVEYFKAVARSTDLPIMIYNNPVDYKIEVTLAMFEQLTALPTIQAVKESTRDVSNVTRMRNHFGDHFKILCGVDTLALEELVLGADGWVAGLVDAFPRETVILYRLVKAGRIAEALAIYRWFLPLLELDLQPKLVQYIKLAQSRVGLGTEFVRSPRLSLINDERNDLIRFIDEKIATRPVLPLVEEVGVGH